MVNVNTTLSDDYIEIVALKYGYEVQKDAERVMSELQKIEAEDLAGNLGVSYPAVDSLENEFLNKQYGTDYISVMPTNLYGPNDNYHPTRSHVLPALIRRFHEAKVEGKSSVTCWGDGSPLREFLYVDDLAELCVFLMNNYSGDETVNAGTAKSFLEILPHHHSLLLQSLDLKEK